MDLQNIFGLIEKVICQSTNFLRICNSFLDLSNFSTVILKKTFRFEIFFGICKIVLDCPFSASTFFHDFFWKQKKAQSIKLHGNRKGSDRIYRV